MSSNFLDQTTPIRQGETVTPSDTENVTYDARALWVGTGGNVVIVTPDGSTITLPNVQDGSLLPINVRRVNSSGTTASNMVALR